MINPISTQSHQRTKTNFTEDPFNPNTQLDSYNVLRLNLKENRKKKEIEEDEKKFLTTNGKTEPKETEGNLDSQQFPDINAEKRKKSFIDFLGNLNEFDKKKIDKLKIISIQEEKKVNIEKETIEKEVKNVKTFKNLSNFLRKILLSSYFSFAATVAIIIVLFLEDIKILVVPKNLDNLIDSILVIIISFIFVEISLFIIIIRSYRFSFFFFLDIISFLSLIPEMMNLFMTDDRANYYTSTSAVSHVVSNAQLAKTSRASVSGTKYGRIANIIRLFNVGKAYKQNLDRFIKKSNAYFEENQLKEMIKHSRRKNIIIQDVKDKAQFFKQINNFFSHPEVKISLRQSRINPEIIKNYFNFTMNKEKQRRKEESKKKENKEFELLFPKKDSLLKPKMSIEDKILAKFKKAQKKQTSIPNNLETLRLKKTTQNTPQISLKNIPQINIITNEEPLRRRASALPTQVNIQFKISEKIEEQDEMSIDGNKNENVPKENPTPPKEIKKENMDILLNLNKLSLPKPVVKNTDMKFCNCDEGSKMVSQANFGLKKKKSDEINYRSKNHLNLNFQKNKQKPMVSPSLQIIKADDLERNLKLNTPSYRNSAMSKLLSPQLQQFTPQGSHLQDIISVNNSERIDTAAKIYSEDICANCKGLKIKGNINEVSFVGTFINENESESDEDEKSNADENISIKGKDTEKRKMTLFGTFIEDFQLDNKHNETVKKKTKPIEIEVEKNNQNDIDKSKKRENLLLKRSTLSLNPNDQRLKKLKTLSVHTSDESDHEKMTEKPLDINVRYINFNFRRNPKLGLVLSKKTTIRVILIILSLLIGISVLSLDTFLSHTTDDYYYIAKLMDNFLASNDTTSFKSLYLYYFKNNKTNYPSFSQIIEFGFADNSSCKLFPDICNENLDGKLFINVALMHHARKAETAFAQFNYLYLTYDVALLLRNEFILGIFKAIFIALILWFGSYLFIKDINEIVVKPLESISKKILSQQLKIDKVYYVLDENHENNEKSLHLEFEDKEDKDSLETRQFLKFVTDYSFHLINIIGLRTFQYLNYKILNQEYDDEQITPPKSSVKLEVLIMIVKIENLLDLLKYFENDINIVYSQILSIIDLSLFEYFGEILSVDNNEIRIIWDMNKINPKFPEINQKKDISYEEDNSENSYLEEKQDVDEEYHSFEIHNAHSGGETSSSCDSNLSFKTETIDPNRKILSIYSLPLLTSLKILSRIYHSPSLISLFKSRDLDIIKMLKISFTIHSGTGIHFILNSSSKIESLLVGKDVQRAVFLSSLAKKYNLNIILSQEYAKIIASKFSKYIREIDIVTDPVENKVRFFSMDVQLQENNTAVEFMKKRNFNKEESLFIRKNNTKSLNNNVFHAKKIFKFNSEIMFVRPKKLNTFVKYFNNGYAYYKKGNFELAKGSFNNAKIYNKKDYRTNHLLEEINQTLRRKKSKILA